MPCEIYAALKWQMNDGQKRALSNLTAHQGCDWLQRALKVMTWTDLRMCSLLRGKSCWWGFFFNVIYLFIYNFFNEDVSALVLCRNHIARNTSNHHRLSLTGQTVTLLIAFRIVTFRLKMHGYLQRHSRNDWLRLLTKSPKIVTSTLNGKLQKQ